ncbi:cysteine synthase family protein [Pseudoalteromonas sp. MMG012]|uniref:cysteine synthase family protein n=1 Tax=Pseudoalteromonas sp. MMG012 TaxID=2822686 RepID=UPI001B3A1C0F|nr:cysteine synthase family protein [Pseudoalteromonas sp. MMG012]MBQ4849491.1 cysteine synthase family protein [Pseudoalteromonas sp. MMG012]
MIINTQENCTKNSATSAYRKVSQSIGNTPLMEFIVLPNGSRMYLKLEQFNPTGSAKIRMAKSMLDEAEQNGLLKPGGRIVESTSGNTGVGLAMLAAERGYHFTAFVDNHAAKDKINNMRAFGAEVVCVSDEGNDGLATDVRDAMAEQVAKEQGALWTAQHNNFANSRGYTELAKEVVNQIGTDITHLVGAVGTGGSLCGTTRALRDLGCHSLTTLGVEPIGSVIFGGPGARYHQSGTGTPEGAEIGALIEYDLIDLGVKVSDKHAFNTARYLTKHYALMVGGSAGGVIYEALKSIQSAPAGSIFVVLVCDGGEKYLDTVFNDQWMTEHQLFDPQLDQQLSDLLQQLKA